jgi:adenylate cyclase
MSLSSRQLRLATGLVLLTYISMHLATHTFGLWSLDLAERGLAWTKALWQSWPGTVALYGAAAVHFALALRTIYQRRHWGLPLIEIVRLWAGFSLPLLLISHVVTTRLTLGLFGVPSDYRRIVGLLVASGNEGWQIALLAPGWLHGCLGLWISLRHVALMRRLKPALIACVVALPVLSAAGFGRMTQAVAVAPPAQSAPLDAAAAEARRDRLAAWQRGMTTVYLVSLIGAFVGGQVRNRIERKAGQTLA